MLVRESDHRLLAAICRGYRGKGFKVGDGLRVLARRLERAVIVPDEEFPEDVAALGSGLVLTEMHNAISFRCVIVLPSQVDLDRRHISVLSLVGATVVGERMGQSTVYRTPKGLRLIRIDCVLGPEGASSEQPAAARPESRGERRSGRSQSAE